MARLAELLGHPLAPLAHAGIALLAIVAFGIVLSLDAPAAVVDASFALWFLAFVGLAIAIGIQYLRDARRWHRLAAAAGWRPSLRKVRIYAWTRARTKTMPDGRLVCAQYDRATDDLDVYLWTLARVGGEARELSERIAVPRAPEELDRAALALAEAARAAEATG